MNNETRVWLINVKPSQTIKHCGGMLLLMRQLTYNKDFWSIEVKNFTNNPIS